MTSVIEPVESGRLINLVPVGLKEAAIDSPTSRATVQHYVDQVDHLERWLDDYLKATNRLVVESQTLENILYNFTSHAVLPTNVSETMLDHDYSVLAMRKYATGAKDYWMSMVGVVKRMTPIVCEPIRSFIGTDIKVFKDTRRNYEQQQKTYDNLQAKYMGLGKYKEPSSLREDAFQLHEARRLYLKAHMDLLALAPQFRFALDKLMVRIFFDQWREMRQATENTSSTFQRSTPEMERIRGWAKEMEESETSFRRELVTVRKQLEETAELSARPSRELDDYSAFTMPGVSGLAITTSNATMQKSPTRIPSKIAEKQGWLFLRTYSSKPTRVTWVKRWAFIRNGVFGWLVQDNRGFVEESERIGVLLCAVRPTPAEERRFVFELKTNKHTLGLQAETQAELVSWLGAFEGAKTKAVDDPSSSGALLTPGQPQSDPAFTISPPPIPEFGTAVLPSTDPLPVDDSIDRSSTLPIPGTDTARESSDFLRRSTIIDEGSRDPASRIMSKLDLHRRTPTSPQVAPSPAASSAGGGIASLIAASHGSMPVGPAIPAIQRTADDMSIPRRPLFTLPTRDMPPSTLAPSTLANVPTPTSLSKAAVVVAAERGIRASISSKYSIPNGILANTWGSSNSSYVNRFDPNELKIVSATKPTLQTSPLLLPSSSPQRPAPVTKEGLDLTSLSAVDLALPPPLTDSRSSSPGRGHRNTLSIDNDTMKRNLAAHGPPIYPANYPLQLKTQDAQFRLLFPNVRRDERLVMVFRATWNPSGTQDFPGRAYVTTKEMYFYSNHFGLVLTSGVSLSSVDEVTAAPGKDCDFLFVHFKEPQLNGSTRITIKTFLEPLKVLQRRLNFLLRNSQSDEPYPLDEVIKTLLKMENETPERSPSLESWEEVAPDTPAYGASRSRNRAYSEFRSPLRVDRNLHTSISVEGDRIAKFKLPAQPVKYSPPGYAHAAIEREYDVSPKALFHVMFGDKSVLWQLLQHEREARDLKQGPWTSMGEGRLFRNFEFTIPTSNLLGQERMSAVKDFQTVDVVNEHLCYVVTDRRTPWHLPFQSSYRLLSKIVITHVAKTKCKLAIYIRVDWSNDPWVLKSVLERHALHDLDLDAQDLVDLVTDQVRKLGYHSRTKKAIQIFGQVGQSTEVTRLQIESNALNLDPRRAGTKRTMTSLLMQNIRSAAQNWLGIVLQSLFDLASWIGKMFSAHTFILLLLVSSALYNSWFMTRDGLDWWHERNTAKFMKRLGVTPNTIMSKAIYLSDLNVAMSTEGLLPSQDSSICYTVFQDNYSLQDVDAPILDKVGISAESGSLISSQSARKVQSTRQRLGSYRHDLLVAMRVVNSIEREVIQSEWEKWLTSENRRCRQIEPAMGAAKNQTASMWEKLAGNPGETDGERKEMVKWYEEYCGSCKEDHNKLVEKAD